MEYAEQRQRRRAERERFPGRQESVSLRHRRSKATWENGFEHSASPPFADTEEVTGSNPVAPTTPALTRAFTAQRLLLMDRILRGGPV